MSNKRNNKQCSCSCKVNRGIIVVTSALSILFAQSRTVTGFVFDKEKQYPLQSVNIFVFGEDIGTVTKEDGSKKQISKCPNGHGKIKSPICCAQDMVCSSN